jgi:translation initiation factor IF-2
LLVADTIDIQANPDGRVIGTVIEAERERARGVLATLLVQNGSLEVGNVVVVGTAYGRLRAMFDHRGRKLRKAGPSTPVSVMGLNNVPHAGDVFRVVASERDARVLVEERAQQLEQASRVQKTAFSLEQLYGRVQAGEERELKLIIKADVQGSLEPIKSSLNDLKSDTININILYAETGNIGENDIMLAAASKAVVIGFNVQADVATRRLAETEGVSIRLYDIIYRMIEDIEKALKGMLEPEIKQVVIGRAEVRAVFHISKVGNIAGCRVVEGEIKRNAKARVLRGGKVVHEGDISSLKHVQDDVREVRQGFECGIALKNFAEIAAGDTIEAFVLEKVSIE